MNSFRGIATRITAPAGVPDTGLFAFYALRVVDLNNTSLSGTTINFMALTNQAQFLDQHPNRVVEIKVSNLGDVRMPYRADDAKLA